MPRVKKSQRASLDEVRIERDGEYAVITFADETVGGVHLKLGPEIQRMSDLEILDRFNEVVADMEANVNAWDQTVIEIPAGKPQIEYAARSRQWVPVGDVLRCIIDEGDDGQPTIWIDDKELSWAEFGRMLLVHNGWGMRIAFVPEEWVHEQPKIEVREPRRDKRKRARQVPPGRKSCSALPQAIRAALITRPLRPRPGAPDQLARRIEDAAQVERRRGKHVSGESHHRPPTGGS